MQAAEADLQSAFRNSALCITQMLKAGQKASKRSFQAGYSTALQDVLEYLQSSLDVNVAQQRSNEGVAQVIDYIEARQEAVRLELQDLEAEEDQAQHAASPRVYPANGGYQASTSSQSFRSHPHHRQPQEQRQQQHSSGSAYRPQSASYQPVASTSGPNGQSATALLHARKQRPSSARPSSSLVSRTSSSNSNPSGQPSQQQERDVFTRPSSSTSLHHQRQTDMNDVEQTRESIPLASSSSIPNSPAGRFSPEIALPPPIEGLSGADAPNRTGNTTPPSVTPFDSTLSNTSTAVSPLTRLQAKRERERHHDRRGRTHGHAHETSSGAQASSAAIAAGVKRRWTAALLPEHHTINLSMNLGNKSAEGMQGEDASDGEDDADDDDESSTSEEGIQQQHAGQRKSGSFSHTPSVTAQEDDTGMETEDTSYRIDGNARPIKRTSRR